MRKGSNGKEALKGTKKGTSDTKIDGEGRAHCAVASVIVLSTTRRRQREAGPSSVYTAWRCFPAAYMDVDRNKSDPALCRTWTDRGGDGWIVEEGQV